MEKERRDLLEQLTSLKESSLYQAAATSSCTLTNTETETELKTIRGEMNQVIITHASVVLVNLKTKCSFGKDEGKELIYF